MLKTLLFVAAAVATSAQAACLPPYTATWTSLGCYTDNQTRTLTGPELVLSSTNDAQACANACGLGGYTYAATEYSTQCFCGNAITGLGKPTTGCNMACSGNASEICGGTYLMNMYQVTNPSTTSSPAQNGLPDCNRDPLCSNPICDTSLTPAERVAGLIANMTLAEKAANMMNAAPGVASLGLPAYNWWSEALHGVAGSPGVSFASPNGTDFSYATSFPTPILMGATFDDALINAVANVIGTEGRAFGNNGHSGFDFWTPNVNGFLDPRWGRGLEVAGEDVFHLQRYVYSLVTGLQGGSDGPERIIATCKHFAVYDVETDRNGDDLNPTPQDLAGYYLPVFKTCARDAKVGALMCSYNAEYGIPSCADRYLLQTVLREHWNWTAPYNWVTSDCSAVTNIENPHNYVTSDAAAAAVALNAGTDLACENTIYNSLVQAVAENITTVATVDKSLTRLYTSLINIGYFNPTAAQAALGWQNVDTPEAQNLAYLAAVEGMTLLKNDGSLPLDKSVSHNIAVIGPWGQATTQMQGNYQGTAPFLISPLAAFQAVWKGNITFAEGTAINTNSTSGFAQALANAQAADVILYCGGIDTSIEAEGMDRTSITWPGNQLTLIDQLAALGKKLVVVQFGGGQVDDSSLLNNTGVNALMWAGYPGQDGGNALRDALDGTYPPAGRLPITQYPADYINQVNLWDPNLRPNKTTGSPGRTYMWYPTPVLPFGYGLHYTNFTARFGCSVPKNVSIASLFARAGSATYPGLANFTTITLAVTNAGNITSDYVATLYLSTKNAGPAPYPIRKLVAYARALKLAPNSTTTLRLPINLQSLARVNGDGDFYVYPGDYTISLDTDAQISFDFSLTGDAAGTLLEASPAIPSNPVALNYLGCYSGSGAISGGPTSNLGSKNEPQNCADSCAAAGYTLSAVQAASCVCGSSFSGAGKADESSCGTACPGDSYEFCGGMSAYNVYNATPPVHPEPPTYAG